jgi:hypothetical protein
MTPEEQNLIEARPGGITDDPALLAILALVHTCCYVAVAEATGFHTGAAVDILRNRARVQFVRDMEKAMSDKEG